MPNVTFDGENKLIKINSGITSISVKEDLYSDWKEWVKESDGSRYALAMSSIGGDPLTGGQSLGSTFFLENGWKVKPYEGDHTLAVVGNLFARDGGSPFVSTTGNYNVRIELKTSNIVDFVDTASVAQNVWDIDASEHLLAGSIGEKLERILEQAELAMLM